MSGRTDATTHPKGKRKKTSPRKSPSERADYKEPERSQQYEVITLLFKKDAVSNPAYDWLDKPHKPPLKL